MPTPTDPLPARLQHAIDFINGCESRWTRDTSPPWGIHDKDPPPYNRLYGPVHARGGVAGVIRHRGRWLAQWGDVHRGDLTFSVAKTYLALLAGLAHDDGLLPDVHEPVVARCPGIGFEGARHGRITWHHLLQQTSEWEGTCLGIPEQVDRYRWLDFQPGHAEGTKGQARPLGEPGSRFEYNDVRINQLSLALLHLFRRPLPEVFEETILRPLGGGQDFRWVGYDDAWVEIAGRRMQSVPGGTHWGGGVSISARDQARVGQLLLDGGRHAAQQLLPAKWVERMQQPCSIAPFYGWLTWLNTGGKLFADASLSSWFMIGAGGNYVWIDPEHHAVVVVRWLDAAGADGFVSRVSKALAS